VARDKGVPEGLTPWQALAYAALRLAVQDAGFARQDTTARDAAAARFWLRFGDGADLVDLLGIEPAITGYLDGLPPLAGQNGRIEVLELARLIQVETNPGD
jgi:hypothetical protein